MTNDTDDGPQDEVIRAIVAIPRKTPKVPALPRPPERRSEGKLAPLVINLVSDVPNGTELALGKVPQRDADAYVRAIRGANERSIFIEIDDAGGDGEGSLAIAFALLQHEFAVTCRIIGKCSSGAALIALAADERSISPDAYVLVHQARRLCTPDQWEAVGRLPQSERVAINDSLNDLDDAAAALLQSRLGVSDATARRWLIEDQKWTAAEALKRGFVHAIDAAIPGGRLRGGYGIVPNLRQPLSTPGETLHGINYVVEIVAESILKCAVPVSSGGGTPGAAAIWAVSRSRILVPGYAGPFDSVVSGRVDILYDQSGNARNISAPTSAKRPIATTSGPNSRACADFSPTSSIVGHSMSTASYAGFGAANVKYIVVSIRPDVVTTNDSSRSYFNARVIENIMSLGNFLGMSLRSVGILNAYNFDFPSNDDKAASAPLALPIGGNPCVIEWRHESGVLYQRVNGAGETSVASSHMTDPNGSIRLGGVASAFLDGKLFEALIYSSVPTLSSRNALVADMMTWVGA